MYYIEVRKIIPSGDSYICNTIFKRLEAKEECREYLKKKSKEYNYDLWITVEKSVDCREGKKLKTS